MHTVIYKFLNIVGTRPSATKYQNENIVGHSNQRHKIGLRAFLFRKTTSRLDKTWKETNPHRKTKTWRIKIVKQEKIVKGSNSKWFCLLHEWRFHSPKRPTQSKSWGGGETLLHEGKIDVFFGVLLPQENLKMFFPEMFLCPFRISSHSSNPPPYP